MYRERVSCLILQKYLTDTCHLYRSYNFRFYDLWEKIACLLGSESPQIVWHRSIALYLWALLSFPVTSCRNEERVERKRRLGKFIFTPLENAFGLLDPVIHSEIGTKQTHSLKKKEKKLGPVAEWSGGSIQTFLKWCTTKKCKRGRQLINVRLSFFLEGSYQSRPRPRSKTIRSGGRRRKVTF